MILALAGNPNCGKTTLFNLITGANGYVGNWPGVTVEKKEAKLLSDKNVTITDLPGIYSLSPYSPEEQCSRDYLMSGEPDVVVQVVDATNLERNLYLALQVIETGLPIAPHLDHGDSFELCKSCVDDGFSSVMIDASSKPFEENIALTRQVVEYAHAHGVVVEAELGTLAGIEDDVKVKAEDSSYTRPEDVQEFVERTGCDSLAIAIGTSHGAYKFKPGTKPQLRFDILEEVSERLPGFPIVLHGSSSVPQEYAVSYTHLTLPTKA